MNSPQIFTDSIIVIPVTESPIVCTAFISTKQNNMEYINFLLKQNVKFIRARENYVFIAPSKQCNIFSIKFMRILDDQIFSNNTIPFIRKTYEHAIVSVAHPLNYITTYLKSIVNWCNAEKDVYIMGKFAISSNDVIPPSFYMAWVCRAVLDLGYSSVTTMGLDQFFIPGGERVLENLQYQHSSSSIIVDDRLAINTGSMIFRNSSLSRRILDSWWMEGILHGEKFKSHPWEQTAFQRAVLMNILKIDACASSDEGDECFSNQFSSVDDMKKKLYPHIIFHPCLQDIRGDKLFSTSATCMTQHNGGVEYRDYQVCEDTSSKTCSFYQGFFPRSFSTLWIQQTCSIYGSIRKKLTVDLLRNIVVVFSPKNKVSAFQYHLSKFNESGSQILNLHNDTPGTNNCIDMFRSLDVMYRPKSVICMHETNIHNSKQNIIMNIVMENYRKEIDCWKIKHIEFDVPSSRKFKEKNHRIGKSFPDLRENS